MAVTTMGMSYRVEGSLAKVQGAQTFTLSPFVAQAMTLATGTGLNQGDKFYYARPTIAGSATLSLDIATAGGLLDVFGDAFAVARVKLIVIKSDVTLCPNEMRITQPAAGVPWLGASADFVRVRPGGSLLWFAPDVTGVVVTATTADLIDIVNSAAGNVAPEIFIAGASA
jgi:hypothetical protein